MARIIKNESPEDIITLRDDGMGRFRIRLFLEYGKLCLESFEWLGGEHQHRGFFTGTVQLRNLAKAILAEVGE